MKYCNNEYEKVVGCIKTKAKDGGKVFIKVDVPKKGIRKILKQLVFINLFQRDVFTYIPEKDTDKPNQVELLFIEESIGRGGFEKRIIYDFNKLNALIPNARWFFGVSGLFNGAENF